MSLRGIYFCILFIGVCVVVNAQRAESIVREDFTKEINNNSRCPESAGTINMVEFDGQSNFTVFPGPIYLCYQDQFKIKHDGNADVTCNDPNPFTIPGIGYAFYKCPPTVSGPSDMNIANDPCIESNPPPTSGPWWSYRDQINGDAIFSNQGQIQDFFNAGKPEQMWFAPHTFDDFANRKAQEVGGSVNVSTGEAFSVIYLNEVQITNKQTNVGGNPLAGSFIISGGLPEWDGTTYTDLGIFKVGNPSVRGNISDSNVTHGELVNFTVPEMGTYIIYAEDGISCGGNMKIIFSDTNGSVKINIGTSQDVPGMNECISFCVEDFQDVASMQFTIVFDPRIISYESLSSINLLGLTEDGSFNFNDVDKGIIRLTWFDITTLGQNFNNGDCIFDLCFDILPTAQPGECSPISITDSPTDIEISTSGGTDLILNSNAGQLCVIPSSTLDAFPKTCNSAPNSFSGSLTFEIYGGTGPYSYSFSSIPTPVTGSGKNAGEEIFIGNLASGPYILKITDAIGATKNIPVNIGSQAPLAVDLDGIDPFCFNLTNGSINATVTGGVPFATGAPYTYEWSNLIYNTPAQTSLPAGNYSVTVTDKNGCTASANEYIGKDPINANFTINKLPTCEQSNNGDVSVIVNGGTPFTGGEYAFQWSSPNNLFQQTDVSRNNKVSPGLLNIRITDKIGCIWDETLDLGFEKELKANFQIDKSLACAGDANGIVRIFGRYDDNSPFSLDGANSSITPAGTFIQVSNDHIRGPVVGPGTYDVTYTDAITGCMVDTTFVMTAPDSIKIDFLADLDCSSPTGGQVSVMATGGTGAYSYVWNDGDTNPIRNNLDAGDYKVTVTDMNLCSDSADISLSPGASISISSFVINNLGCGGNDTGGINAVVNATSNNLTYNWSGPGGPFPNSPNLSNLQKGTYILTVNDENGCMDIDTAVVAEGALFAFDVVQTLPFCNNESNGTLAVVVSSPGSFSFNWDHPNNDNTELLQNIPPGSYNLSVTEDNGCTIDTTIILAGQPIININLSMVTDASCSYSTDARAVATASGGKVNNGNYGFLWSSGEGRALALNNTANATKLGSKQQYVIAFDQECADTLFFNINAPDSLMIDQNLTEVNNTSCFGTVDGNVTLAGRGGTPGYQYFWPDLGVNNDSIGSLAPGYYLYVIADANNCVTEDSILISEPDSLVIQIDSTNTRNLGCSNDEDGVIFVQVTGGNINAPYSFEWNDGISTTNSANGLGQGEFFITVTDIKGCTDSTTYTMIAPPPITAVIPDPDAPICFGDKTCISIQNATGGSGQGYRFSINNGPLFPIDSCVSVFAGVYELSVYDNSGCSYDSTLTIDQPEELIINLGPDLEVDLGDSTTIIELTLDGPNPISEIFWDPNSNFACINDDCDRIAIFPSKNTLYTVVAEDVMGCTATDEILIKVSRTVRVFFPNAFSPNGDGFNDIFNVFTGRGIQSIDELRIFDRWGNQMFVTMNILPNNGGTEGWDGRFNGSDVDSGVYTYFAKVTLIDNEQVKVRGDVTLMR